MILDTIKNEDACVELVHEYFNGQYTKDQVRTYLFQFNPFKGLTVRKGVEKLSEEWNNLPNHDESTITNWYKTTGFYIFDLLPWNACDMFKEKMDQIYAILFHEGGKSIIDYGAGLGITTFLIKEKFPFMDVTYCDFKDSHQFKFCEFLMKKLGIEGIQMIDVDEFLNEIPPKKYDVVLAMDCFEHIPNLDTTLRKVLRHTNLLVHDSEFSRNEAQPQHVNANGPMWFINLMLGHNFFMEKGNFRVFRKFRMTLDNNQLNMTYFKTSDDIYEV